MSADGTPVEVVRGLELGLEAGSFGAPIGCVYRKPYLS
jgi:hypothetical protein